MVVAWLVVDTELKMATVGEQLRRAREAKGLSLEQISRATKIHLNTLTAIEEDRAAAALSPIYLKGFIKTYSRHIGLNAEPLLAALAPSPHSAPPAPPVAPRPAAQHVPTARALDAVVDRLQQVPWRALGIAAVVLLLVIGVGRWRSSRRPRRVAAPAATVAASKRMPATSRQHTATPVKTSKPAKPPRGAAASSREEGVRLTVSVESMTWMQVMADGVVIFQQVLQPGARETWLARKEITLWLGDAGGVSLDVNGRQLSAPRKRGEVVRGLRITSQGIQR